MSPIKSRAPVHIQNGILLQSELRKLISDKKEMHAKWKEQKELGAHNNGQIFSNHLE